MFRKIPKQTVYFILIIAPFWLLFFNSPFWHGLKLKAMGAAASVISIANFPLDEMRILLSYRRTYAEFLRLQHGQQALKEKARDVDDALGENERLKDLLGFKGREDLSTTAARVIARDPANWNSSLIIDKGRRDGVRAGMPVLNALGVAGKVAEVAERSAKVILVNDPGFSVAVVNRRTREAGLLSGSLSGACRLSYLPVAADVKAGDEIVTARLSGVFPEGLLVGQVVQLDHRAGDDDRRGLPGPR